MLTSKVSLDHMIHRTFVQRLRGADWFTARVSVCGLFATTYPRAATEAQDSLRTLFKELSRDETPMVRRAAALNIGPFAGAMEPSDVQVRSQYVCPQPRRARRFYFLPQRVCGSALYDEKLQLGMFPQDASGLAHAVSTTLSCVRV